MSYTVRAAVLNTTGELEIEQLTLGEPEADEVLIRTCDAGLCHSDLHEMNGTFSSSTPILLGHEAAGFVEAVGANVTSVRPGDRVVTCLSIFCGQSRYCLSGRLTLCANRSATVLKDPGRLRNHAGRRSTHGRHRRLRREGWRAWSGRDRHPRREVPVSAVVCPDGNSTRIRLVDV